MDALLVACAGCSSGPAVPPAPTTSAAASAASATSPAAVSGPTSAPHIAGPPKIAGLAWRPVGTFSHGHAATYVATTKSGAIGLMWMDPSLLAFRFVPGSAYPEHSPILPQDRQVSSWVPHLAAAFNGAFKLSDQDGGYYYAGVTVSPLRTGLASMVVTKQGRLSVVVWGRGSVSLGGVQAVRQNLPPLVDEYVARTSPRDSNHAWGWADHDTALANRSALGQLADGSLVYAYGYQVHPADMAAAMVLVHARTAIMLDMNLSQPGGFVYEHPTTGAIGQRIQASIFHNATVYLKWYKKDFVVALIRG